MPVRDKLKMHVRNEHRLNLTKMRMKCMFTTRSQATHLDEISTSGILMIVHPPSPQLSSTSDDDDMSPISEDPIRAPGLCDFVSGHSAPVDDDNPPTYPSLRGKLSLSQLFNFESSHWVNLYKECATMSFEEELTLYDILNEDSAAGEGMEVDVDETTADILIS